MFFLKATVTQLKAIVASGRRHLKAHLPSSPTKDMLLETVLNMRTEETVQSRLSHRSPEESLRELLNLSPEELQILASSDASNLAELMRSALQADENLQPRDIPASVHSMLIMALSWQLHAHKSANTVQDNEPPPPPRLLPTRVAPSTPVIVTTSGAARDAPKPPPKPQLATTPLPPHPANLAALIPQREGLPASFEDILTGLRAAARSSLPAHPAHADSDDDLRTGKRQRLHLVPQGFTLRSIANIEQLLKHYRGKAISSSALSCRELLGPYILVQFIQAGNNIPTFLQDFKHWQQRANGAPS